MNTGKALFAQLMDFLPWTTFTRIVDRYGGDHRVRTLSCAEQYRSMAFAQLTYRESLRDIETCLSVHASKLYHMGFRQPVRRSTLADANERRDWRIHAALAQRLITQARTLYVDEELGLDLTNTVYALDSTTIALCLSVFPWAHFRTTKAAVKMHTLLDLRGNIPSFIHISDGKLHDVQFAASICQSCRIAGAIRRRGSSATSTFATPLCVAPSRGQGDRQIACQGFRTSIAHRVYSAPTDVASFVQCQCRHLRRQTISLKEIDGFPHPVRITPNFSPAHPLRRRPRVRQDAGLHHQQLLRFRPPPSSRSTKAAGRWNSSSSGSSSIFGSSSCTADVRRTR